jgi:phospholipid/cholesterol/gamma-HCH transport system substrate-binding protein
MQNSLLETLIGAVVVTVAVVFLVFAVRVANTGTVAGYELAARFDRVDGLDVGSDVRMGGIKIGSVVRQSLDPVTYRAIVTFTVEPNIKIPADTSASIESESLLGGRYLALVPGGDDRMLNPGQEIRYTQASVSLEQLLGKFLGGGMTAAPGGATPAPAPTTGNTGLLPGLTTP